MVRGTADIYAWFEATKMSYWAIYNHKGIASGNRVLQSDQETDQTAGTALEDLKRKLRVIARGTFTLVAYNTPEKLPTKGYQMTDIEVYAESATPAMAAVSGPSMNDSDIQAKISAGITEALDKYKREQEIEALKKENAELKKENRELERNSSEPFNKILGALAPHSDKIIAGIFPGATPAAQVAGIPATDARLDDNGVGEEETNLTLEQQENVSDFLSTLAANDPEWENTLRRLTAAIQKNPSMISMVKNFI